MYITKKPKGFRRLREKSDVALASRPVPLKTLWQLARPVEIEEIFKGSGGEKPSANTGNCLDLLGRFLVGNETSLSKKVEWADVVSAQKSLNRAKPPL